ncbi:MAG TPA: 16S rRNA (guanine(966)-N(2))-methyltransferase RsmD [Terracidiphilus sp.]|nr:16S rRNA (guanine(966)-N(2))-methyltransferase RsmD [Terracidiphilus sp.]
MRVIAGRFRSRVLDAPVGRRTRPTSDRLRETLFNVLTPRMEGARFLDLYAGSGAVGLEALSRGAREAVMVERDEAALNVLRGNVAKLGLAAECRTHASGVAAWLKRGRTKAGEFDVVFLDPPYEAEDEYALALGLLGAAEGEHGGLLARDGVVVAEHRKKQELEVRYGRLRRTRVLKQGDAALSFYCVEAQTTGADKG